MVDFLFLISGEKYNVRVLHSLLYEAGSYCLYFRGIGFDDYCCMVLKFSETLADNSVFYYLFIDDDDFEIYETGEKR